MFKEIKQTTIYFLILMTCTLLAGCIYFNYPDYPKEWGSIISNQGLNCVDLSGKYLNEDNNQKRTLSGILLGITRNTIITHVQILQSKNDSVLMTFWDENKIVKEMTYHKNINFQCNNEEVVIQPGKERYGKTDILGVSNLRVHLMKNEDGWLIIKLRTVEYGLFGLLIPIASESDVWYRFAPLQ